jgi:hypothetical protein
MPNSVNATLLDKDTQLKDAGLVGASAAAQVGGAARVLDVGLAKMVGKVVIDTSAVEVATGNELYQIEAQFSNDIAFGSGIVIPAVRRIGDSSVTFESSDHPAAGRYEMHVSNEAAGVLYRYMRLFTRVSGTIDSGGINYKAHLVPTP